MFTKFSLFKFHPNVFLKRFFANASCPEPPTRRYCVAGNWKMNGNTAFVKELCKELSSGLKKTKAEVIIAPPFVYIPLVRSLLPRNVDVGGQNAYKECQGPYTGEIAPSMLHDVGATWVILGHSERRQLFHESDTLIAEKCRLALCEELSVIVCVGENLQQREKNETEKVIDKQLCALAEKLKSWCNLVIAYEPVWAIGTGQSATPEEAQCVHKFIRKWVEDNVNPCMAQTMRIQYGGSVNSSNCKELAKQPDIDGFLVGQASLCKDFLDIVRVKDPPKCKKQK